jgi:uncharacterized membrane protein YfcA
MSEPAAPRTAAPLWFVPAGFLIGVLGALSGIGGGLVAGPLLHAASKLSLKRASATALLNVLATTAAATVAELLRADSRLDLGLVAALALGALAGAELGFRVQQRMSERTLKRLFVVVLLVAGVRVLFFAHPVAGGLAPGPVATTALALAIGLAGGFFVPLLGIGGGMVMVPALFLSMSPLGFSGARACALAAGAVAAVRSLALHVRAGNVEVRPGALLAIGALLGALAGVVLAHDSRVADVGRVLLGLVLVVQALRFLHELRRPG